MPCSQGSPKMWLNQLQLIQNAAPEFKLEQRKELILPLFQSLCTGFQSSYMSISLFRDLSLTLLQQRPVVKLPSAVLSPCLSDDIVINGVFYTPAMNSPF